MPNRRAVSIDWLLAGGDMNAAGREATPDRTKLQHAVRLHDLLQRRLLSDAWTLLAHPGVGFTCCQAVDLSNRASELYERIDLIWSLRRPVRVVDTKLIGNTMGDKTRPPGNGGLWPSDHASLAAKLFFD